MRARTLYVGGRLLALVLVLGIARTVPRNMPVARAQAQPVGAPVFDIDPSWPRALPNNWALGQVASVAVDSGDHVWILHRPKTVPAAEIAAGEKQVAPQVIEFDPDGNVVQARGGPGVGYS